MRALVFLLLFAVAVFAQPVRPVEEFQTRSGQVRITPIRHATMLIQAGGKTLYIDPVGQGNWDGLSSAADLIVITDIHGDHLDPVQVGRLRKSGTEVFGPQAVADKLPGTTVIRNGESKQAAGWKIDAVPAYNVKRGPLAGSLYHDKGRGNGYVLTFGGKRFYISGDTEGVPEMRALKGIDVAFVCMNLPYTMPPEEAADAVRAFHPAVVYPYHDRGSDLSVFQKALAGTGIDVRIRDWYY